jgi:hypothetical protein
MYLVSLLDSNNYFYNPFPSFSIDHRAHRGNTKHQFRAFPVANACWKNSSKGSTATKVAPLPQKYKYLLAAIEGYAG